MTDESLGAHAACLTAEARLAEKFFAWANIRRPHFNKRHYGQSVTEVQAVATAMITTTQTPGTAPEVINGISGLYERGLRYFGVGPPPDPSDRAYSVPHKHKRERQADAETTDRAAGAGLQSLDV